MLICAVVGLNLQLNCNGLFLSFRLFQKGYLKPTTLYSLGYFDFSISHQVTSPPAFLFLYYFYSVCQRTLLHLYTLFVQSKYTNISNKTNKQNKKKLFLL